MTPERWKRRRVFLTGHTGFKGSWLLAWLTRAGAEVTSFALPPATKPSLFEAASLERGGRSIAGDIRDLDALRGALAESRAEVVFHLAAQSLVRESYERAVDTYATNVMGTVHLLEAVRSVRSVRAVVVVTSDKCYENREWPWPYRENEPLGGRDPYSSSKACAELVTAAYRDSFFGGGAAVATARAGNVIGGGDWARDRLVPDLLRAFENGRTAMIRNPGAVRPWQHVLDPLHGYLLLAEALLEKREHAAAWNFGPYDRDVQPVRFVADALSSAWGSGAAWTHDGGPNPHEAMTLKLDSSRARTILGWRPRLALDVALQWVVEWHRAFADSPERAREITLDQIARYEGLTA
ncbi:MAG TPA: CDP-glucose 4,6-dehydratase [Thermoanaerobaculia bacterium]